MVVARISYVAGCFLLCASVALGSSLEDTSRVIQSGPQPVAAAPGFAVREVGSALWARVTDLAVQRPFAYAIQPYGLLVFDISNTSAPEEVSRLRITGGVTSIALYGHYVLVTSYYGGMHVIDISDPYTPTVVSTLGPSGQHVVVYEGRVYLVAARDGFSTVNLDNPAAPFRVGHYPTPAHGFFSRVAIHGTTAYIAARSSTIHVVDISDPAHLMLLNDPKVGTAPVDLAARDSVLYASYSLGSLAVYDVSDPAAPIVDTQLVLDNSLSMLRLSDTILYCGFESGVQRLSVGDPRNPRVLSTILTSGMPVDADLQGDTLYLAGDRAPSPMIDWSDGSAPISFGALPPYPQETFALDVAEGVAYVGSLDNGLSSVDVRGEGHLPVMGTSPINFQAHQVDAEGALVAVATREHHLHVFQGGLGQAPELLHTVGLPDLAKDVEMLGSYAYVVMPAFGVYAYDVSIPTAPVQVGEYAVTDEWLSLDASSDHLYVAAASGKVDVLNISDPTQPLRVGGLTVSFEVADVKVGFPYALLLESGWGVRIADVAIPPTAQLVGSLPHQGGGAGYIATWRHYGLVMNRTGRYVQVLDWSDPTRPRTVTTFNTPGYPQQAIFDGEFVYMTDTDGFLKLKVDWTAGDVNVDRVLTTGDIIYLVNFCFRSGETPLPREPYGDFDCNGKVNLADILLMVSAVLRSGESLTTCVTD